MNRRLVFGIALPVVAAGAMALRLPRLSRRPMHCDEAVHALKFRDLWVTGRYAYDRDEYHGPALYYLTLPSVAASVGVGEGPRARHDGFVRTTEADYRFVAATAGIWLVLLALAASGAIGRAAAICAAAGTAVSPAMVYYSRYYIHEMLLVLFTLAALLAGWRYVWTRRARWALLAGACIGLMHATKETCVLAWAAMGVGAVGAWAWDRRVLRVRPGGGRPMRARHLVAAAVVALAVSGLLFSSFLTNPRGPVDAVAAYGTYFFRAGEEGRHEHPWYYYWRILLTGEAAAKLKSPSRYAELHWRSLTRATPVWSEGLILLLAGVGAVAALARRRGRGAGGGTPARFLVFYTAALGLLYSGIPYKTPWCMLTLLHALILLAGVGAAALLRWARVRPAQIAVGAVLAVGAGHLALQAHRAAFAFAAHPLNPYVYAHTSEDLLGLVDRVRKVAAVSGRGRDITVNVIAPAHAYGPASDYWPLPWYLRGFRRVSYADRVPERPHADVVVVGPGVGEDLRRRLRDDRRVAHYGLRPWVVLAAYVRRDLWDASVADGQAPTAPPASAEAPTAPGAPPASRPAGLTPALDASAPLHRFAHRAMAARFQIVIADRPADDARRAARAAFDELDRLERRLSRFIDTSDVARINAADPGARVRIDPVTAECLWAARKLHADTDGAFDVTVGALLDCWREPDGSPRRPTEEEFRSAMARVGMPLLEVDLAQRSVVTRGPGVVVDLGGIAKGFALDRMADVLRRREVGAALLACAGSTARALGAPAARDGWKVALRNADPDGPPLAPVVLRDNALSGSGVSLRGRHIIDPRNGTPVRDRLAAWATAPTATTADALSTAFMVMSVEEVRRYCRRRPDASAILVGVEPGPGGLVKLGTTRAGEDE